MIRALLVACLFASSASASPLDDLTPSSDDAAWGEPVQPPGVTPQLVRPARPHKQFALAVNNPLAWGGFAYAASGYVVLSEHQALRMNLARFKTLQENPGVFLLASVLSGEPVEDEAEYRGGFFDVGAGWMYFPRRVWSGATFELGAVLRTRHTYVNDEYASPETEIADTWMVAGRGLMGWTWDIRGRVFIAVAVGASYGHETGTNATMGSYDAPTMAVGVSRWTPGLESYSRLGVMF